MLIAIEGLDQGGKATQARELRARLERDGYTTRGASFPDYETPIGQEIAKALRNEREFAPDVMQLLYIANRFEYKPRLSEFLAAGHIIVCDRYRASSVAYGEAHGLDPAWLEEIQTPLPAATLTLLLDIAPGTAVARKAANRDRYERDLALLSRVRKSYQRQAAVHGWVVINGEQPKDEVGRLVDAAVRTRLAPR